MSFIMKIKICAVLSITLVFLGLIVSCKTVKPAEPLEEFKWEEIKPESTLTFENIEADNPETLYLDYKIDLYNTTSNDAELRFQTPVLMINGTSADGALFSLELPENELLTKQERRNIPLRLIFHASEYEKINQSEFDEFTLDLTLSVQFFFPDKTADTFAHAQAVFPRIRKPNFTITMIQIMQAELINTRLKVSIQVDNPNHFPVELTSFNYELYGDGRFWAEGEEKNVLNIPAKDSAGIDLFLTMNFTNMRRNVLDQVIRMTEVRYRFKGNAAVKTGTSHIPRFVMDFENAGHSDVVR